MLIQHLQERPLRKSASYGMSRSARSAPRRVRPAAQAGLHEPANEFAGCCGSRQMDIQVCPLGSLLAQMVRLKAPPTERARQA